MKLMEDYNLRAKINLNKIENVQNFMKVCNGYEEDINVYSQRLVIDGKSILGLYSFDLSKDIEVEILTPDKKAEEKFYKDISKFEVE